MISIFLIEDLPALKAIQAFETNNFVYVQDVFMDDFCFKEQSMTLRSPCFLIVMKMTILELGKKNHINKDCKNFSQFIKDCSEWIVDITRISTVDDYNMKVIGYSSLPKNDIQSITIDDIGPKNSTQFTITKMHTIKELIFTGKPFQGIEMVEIKNNPSLQKVLFKYDQEEKSFVCHNGALTISECDELQTITIGNRSFGNFNEFILRDLKKLSTVYIGDNGHALWSSDTFTQANCEFKSLL